WPRTPSWSGSGAAPRRGRARPCRSDDAHSIERAHDPPRQEVDGEQKQRTVKNKAVIEEAANEFGEQHERGSANERPSERAEASKQDDEQEEDRGLQRKRIRAEVSIEEREQPPAGAGERSGQSERDGPDAVGREPQGLRRQLGVLHGHQRASPRRGLEVAREQQRERGGERDQPVVAAQRQRPPAEHGLGDVEDPAGPRR